MFRIRRTKKLLLASLFSAGLLALGGIGLAEEPRGSELFYLDPRVVRAQDPLQVPDVGPGVGALPVPSVRELREQAGGRDTELGVGTGVFQGGAPGAQTGGDIGNILQTSTGAAGVEFQQRSPIANDPRIRGFRVGQIVTYGDGGFFFPARQDLDTAINKFDPSTIADVSILKGPYSARFGPGFSFINITTDVAPRSRSGCREVHGRTSIGYQVNGVRPSLLQSVEVADTDWGFRLNYDIKSGIDYHAGGLRTIQGTGIVPGGGSTTELIPGSFNAQNFSFAAGYWFGEGHTIQFKGLRLLQQNVEFPGLYFDINQLDSEAYSVRYRIDPPGGSTRFIFDAWYNYTGADGNTQQFNKQQALTPLLTAAFSPPAAPGQPQMITRITQDRSDTGFAEQSQGYRGLIEFGEKDKFRFAIGHDLNFTRQRLTENIRLVQSSIVPGQPNFDPNLVSDPTAAFLTSSLGVPSSRFLDPGIFADFTLPLTKRWTVGGGARADWMFTDSATRLITGNIVLTPGSQFSPNAIGQVGGNIPPGTSLDPLVFSTNPNDPTRSRHFGLYSVFMTTDFKIDDHFTALARVGYAERAPTLTELYATGPFVSVLQQGFNRVIGDPHLKEERLTQIDLGLRADFEVVRAGINGYYSWVDDYITYDLNRGGANTINQVIFTNTDLATLAGTEIYGEVDVLEWFTPFVTVAYVQGRDRTHIDNRRPGNLVSSRRTMTTEPLPGIPPLELKGGFRLHDGTTANRWNVTFLVRSVMGQNLIAASLGELPTSGFTVFDVRGYYRVNDSVTVSAGLENLGDKFYREHLDPRAADQLWRIGTNFFSSVEVKY